MSMSLRRQLLPVLILLLSVTSCEYISQDIHYVEPEAGTEPLLLPLTNLEADSVYVVRDSMLVAYEVFLNAGELYYIEASIGNLVHYSHWPSYDPDTSGTWPVAADSFYLEDVFHLDSGLHTLYMDFYHSTNSNSLADMLSLEYEMYTLEYQIILEND